MLEILYVVEACRWPLIWMTKKGGIFLRRRCWQVLIAIGEAAEMTALHHGRLVHGPRIVDVLSPVASG
jgi:hypothetical protein